MKPQFKQIVKDLGYQLNITLLEEQLEDIMDALVIECAEFCKNQKLTPSAFTGDDLMEHFGVKND